MKSWFFTKEGEFRILWLYIPAVLAHGVFATMQMPVLEVIWDSVFYKGLARGFYHIGTFDLKQHFPIAPLYPFFLVPGFFASSYRTVEAIHSWVNPALYFGGLFFLYSYSRIYLSVRRSVFTCLLFIAYPSAVYAQWTMSENLAVPLVLALMVSVLRMGRLDSLRYRDSILPGLLCAALVLTRLSLAIFCAVVLLWLVVSTCRQRRNPVPAILACGLSVLAVFSVWWVIGYGDVSPVYLDFGDQSLTESVRAFWTIFIAHWSALWLEGGLLLPVLVLTQCFWCLFNKNEDTALRGLSMLLLLLYIALTVGSSFFFAKRLAIEAWSISLRYVFYGNVVALPLFVASLGSLRQSGFKALCMRLGLCLVVLGFLSIGLFLPESWDKLTNSYAYFHNSPTLDVVYQFRNEGVIPVTLALIGASLGSAALAYRYRRAGLAGLLVLLLYIQGASLGYIQHTRDFTIHYCRGKNILAFCDWLEEADYRQYEVFCEEEYPFLLPNLYYWLNQPSSPFPGDIQKIARPCLLLTTHAYPEEKLLFMSDDLRAYFLPSHE